MSGSSNEGPATTATPEPTPPTWKATNLAAKLATHGVDEWHARGLKGDNVKVGIIDWGFAGYDQVWNLDPLRVEGEEGVAKPNAFCQPVDEGIMPGTGSFLLSKACQPRVAGGLLYSVSHGVNIAELVRDIAPKADLYLAQANGPKQLKAAADWLAGKEVDVIVAANGWHYDGRGNGTSPFTATKEAPSSGKTDEHSLYRSYPSPLATVDSVVTDTASAPVWINAAGNAERWTMWVDDPTWVNNRTSKWDGYLKFHPTKTDEKDQTCQSMKVVAKSVNLYSMRWADTWDNGQHRLEYEMSHEGAPGVLPGDYNKSESHDQHATTTVNYPVRRTSKVAKTGFDVCLRIKMTNITTRPPVGPEWVQFQNLTSGDSFGDGPAWALERHSGRSVVNPAESANAGLLAVGAENLRGTGFQIMPYSSRGFVFDRTADVLEDDPARLKPDAVAGSGAITHAKWRSTCANKPTLCSAGADLDGFYFAGTSAATGHTGGLAALVTQLHDRWGLDTTPATIASYLREVAVDQSPTGDDNVWGKGFLKLPCPSTHIGTAASYSSTDAEWSAEDCESEQRTGRYSDYYTFTLDAPKKVTIDLTSTDQSNTYLYLFEGRHLRGTLLESDDNDGNVSPSTSADNKYARIVRTLQPGSYTIEATTYQANRTGDYTISVVRSNPDASLSPNPENAGFTADGTIWKGFTVNSEVEVDVVANPTGKPKRIEIENHDPGRSYCAPEREDDKSRSGGDTVYLAACSEGIGTVELRSAFDDTVLETYKIDVSAVGTTPDPTPVPTPTPNPTPDPRPVTAILLPAPPTVDFKDNGDWHSFRVTSSANVKVVANPTGTTPRVEIALSSITSDYCGNGATNNDPLTVSSGTIIKLAGCSDGTGTVSLRAASDDALIRTYTFDIDIEQVCKVPTSFTATRASASQVSLSWRTPTGADSKTPTGYRITVMKWVNGKWQHERYINEPPNRTSALHLGLDGGFYYAYQVSTKCGANEYSAATSWKTVSTWPGGSGRDGVSGAGGPDPTPTPSGTGDTGSQEPIDEMPPTPQ